MPTRTRRIGTRSETIPPTRNTRGVTRYGPRPFPISEAGVRKGKTDTKEKRGEDPPLSTPANVNP